jgi:GR25 family glycosyltransferase involved in LPS biosynthesis
MYIKKINVKNIVLFMLISALLLLLLWGIFEKKIEGMDTNNINMYVISLRHKDRIDNIKSQEKKIGKSVTIFDAVKGDQLNPEQLFNDGIISEKYKTANKQEKRVIGCYMSHYNVLQKIKKDNKDGYTVIFEDDFYIDSPNFLTDVENILQKVNNKRIDFDLIYLGNIGNSNGSECTTGCENIIDNIYNVDKTKLLYGSQGYLVNNKNIDKIIENTKLIDEPIDNKYSILGNNGTFKNLIICPSIVNQQSDIFPSNINDLSIETFC